MGIFVVILLVTLFGGQVSASPFNCKSINAHVLQGISSESSSQWEEVSTMCPNQCTCQYQSFASFSQSRWIDVNVSPDHPFVDPEANIKAIMCIIQNEIAFRDVVPSIPSDVQAITFLFTGTSTKNVTESKLI